MFRWIATTTLILFLGSHAAAQEKRDKQFYIDQIDAVFGTDHFSSRPEAKERYVELLRDRISYAEKPGVFDTSKYELLSTVGFNKNVSAEQAAFARFDPDTFNPLLYNMLFFDWGRTHVYRIDGTDVFIIVQPQTPAK